jgi:hypothetical protein
MRGWVLALVLLLIPCEARADDTRIYSPLLVKTGIAIGATGVTSMVAGGIWMLVVLSGPTEKDTCTIDCGIALDQPQLTVGPRLAWDSGPGVPLIAAGGAAILLGAALAAIGVQRVRVETTAGRLSVAF